FTVRKAAAGATIGPRLGRLTQAGRGRNLDAGIETPNFIAVASRGVVPHLTPDMVERHTGIESVLMGLEDFIEKAPATTPPILSSALTSHASHTSPSSPSPLHLFTGTPSLALTVLSARRLPPVPCPPTLPNSDAAIGIHTSVGFRSLAAADYARAVGRLGPDVVVALADVPFGAERVSVRRREKMAERTGRLVGGLVEELGRRAAEGAHAASSIFAPVLPIPLAQQRFYLDELAELASPFSYASTPGISGLALYDPSVLAPCPAPTDHHDHALTLPAPLTSLPRLSLAPLPSPHALLRAISHGADLLAASFVSRATDAGIALDFSFTSSARAPSLGDPAAKTTPRPLGTNLWDDAADPPHATSLAPLAPGCRCYACAAHHRAYVAHLLRAREMLAWTLLALHNAHVLDAFLRSVRASIARGDFEADAEAFAKAYNEEGWPEGVIGAEGPRVRGYQVKSGRGEPKRNRKAWGGL
ncbi:tRNA-guanine(15) transglycosylase-like protein, partial [Lineolata rhizophorae]